MKKGTRKTIVPLGQERAGDSWEWREWGIAGKLYTLDNGMLVTSSAYVYQTRRTDIPVWAEARQSGLVVFRWVKDRTVEAPNAE